MGADVGNANIVAEVLGGAGTANLARSVGASPEQIELALEVIVPRLSQALERNTLSRGGLADLVEAIGDGRHEAYLKRPELLGSDTMRADGDAILGHILGSKDSSRSLASRAAATSGIGEGIIRQLLPIIAALLMGGLAKATKGGLGDILSKIPGLPGGGSGMPSEAPRPSTVPGGSEMPRMPQPMPRSPQPAPGGGIDGGDSPLPIPGNDIPGVGRRQPNPYEDLSDVIRRGGTSMPGGGSLGGIVRDILGSVLGFQSKGFLGWLVRLIVMRWGWGLLQSILRRLLMGR